MMLSHKSDLPENTELTPQVKETWYFYRLIIFACLGGFLFGYDTGVISGAMIPLKRVFHLSIQAQQVIVSVTIAGAIIGSWISGLINYELGRRLVLLLASVFFTIGSIVLGFSNSVSMLVLGRSVLGLGIGIASMTVPVYIAEVAPPENRGKLITIYQLNITGGQFIASVMNGVFSYWSHAGWRLMLGASGIPSIVMFFGCLCIPESPRWLIQKGKINEARTILQSMRGDPDVDDELDNIVETVSAETSFPLLETLRNIISKTSTRHALILGCGLQIIQQLSAINTVMYYSASIIQLVGVDDEKLVIWLAAAVAFGNCSFTLASFYLIEKIGRRKLTLFSVFGVILALCLLALIFYILDHQQQQQYYQQQYYAWLAVSAMIFYLAMFAPGLGPMPWTINAEIYPLWARNMGTSLSTSTNWLMNLLVSFTFLSLMDAVSRAGAFILYAIFTLLGLVFLFFLLPETKGKKLEDIIELFEKHSNQAEN